MDKNDPQAIKCRLDLDGVELAKEPETVVQYLKTEYPDVKVSIRLIPWAIEFVRLKHCSLTGYFESRGNNNTAIWLVSSDSISGVDRCYSSKFFRSCARCFFSKC